MRNYSDSKFNKIFTIVMLTITIFCILIFVCKEQLDKHITKICEYKSREIANEIITNAINNQLKGSSSKGYINIERNEQNKIISIETNTDKINRLQSELKTEINNSLSHIPNHKINIPIGTLTGFTFLSGRGPDVSLKLYQNGATDTEIISEFTSSGINQTRHRLILRATVELSAIMPIHSTEIEVKNDYVIAETIIVGEVPDGFITANNCKSIDI